MLKDYQLDPMRSTLLHVDLHEVRLDRPIQAQVAVEVVGEAAGANVGGVLSQIIREVTVEALPMAIPDRLELDVSALEIGDSVRVAEIVVPDGVTILDDSEAVAATVAPRRVESKTSRKRKRKKARAKASRQRARRKAPRRPRRPRPEASE